MIKKRIAALLLSTVMVSSLLAGCGGIDKGAVAATLDGSNIELGLVNFVARLEQANSDDFYSMYYGQGISFWKNDNGSGSTMEQALAQDVLGTMQEIYLLEKHMEEYHVTLSEEEQNAIKTAASSFMEANSKKALKALGAEQSYVEEYLRLTTIQKKMRSAITAGADTDVSDEEAKTSSYSYVEIAKSSEAEDADTVAAELEDLMVQASSFAEEAAGGSLEEAAESNGYTVSAGTFTQEDDSLDEEVLTALKGLKEGEVSGLIETDSAYFVVRLDAELDPDATEATRESIIEERGDTLYSETIEGWKENSEWTIDEKAVGRITFDNLFTTRVEETETADDTQEPEESADTTEDAAEAE